MITDKNLKPGTVLEATYKGTYVSCEVIDLPDGWPTTARPIGFRVDIPEDHGGPIVFRSPHAAASCLKGGKPTHGWKFWTVKGADRVEQAATAALAAEKPAKAVKTPPAPKAGKTAATRAPKAKAVAVEPKPKRTPRATKPAPVEAIACEEVA